MTINDIRSLTLILLRFVVLLKIHCNMKFLIIALLGATAFARLHGEDAERDLSVSYPPCNDPCIGHVPQAGSLVCEHDGVEDHSCFEVPTGGTCFPGTTKCYSILFSDLRDCRAPCHPLTPFPTGTTVCQHDNGGDTTCFPATNGCFPGSTECFAINSPLTDMCPGAADWKCGDPWVRCNDNPLCLCDLTAEGVEFCWNNFSCGDILATSCTSSNDCAPDWHCVTSCCGQTCAPECLEGGFSPSRRGLDVAPYHRKDVECMPSGSGLCISM